MRASRILQARQERGFISLAQLCEERDDSQTRLNAAHNTLFVPPRLSFPPQTPYSVGSNSFRPNPIRDRLSPPRRGLEEGAGAPTVATANVASRSPPEHMAPKRSKYTSPPPPDAPDELVSFESRLDEGLSLATAPTDAREEERAYMSSSSNSEIMSDDGDIASDVALEDDAKSVQSFTGELNNMTRMQEMRPFFSPSSIPRMSGTQLLLAYQQAKIRALDDHTPTPLSYIQQGPRGRKAARLLTENPLTSPTSYQGLTQENLRRSNSGPSRSGYQNRFNFGTAVSVPLPPSPVTHLAQSPTVYYETNPHSHRGTNTGTSSYSNSPVASPVNPLTLYQQQYYLAHAHAQAQAQAHGQSHFVSEQSSVLESIESFSPHNLGDTTQQQRNGLARPLHSHTHSSSTIVGPPTPAASSFSLSHLQPAPHSHSRQSSPSPTHSSFRRSADFSHLNPIPSTSPRHAHTPSSCLRTSVRLDLSLESSPEPTQNEPQQSTQSPSSPHLSSSTKHMTRRSHEIQSPSDIIESRLEGELQQSKLQTPGESELKINFEADPPCAHATDSPIDSPPYSSSPQSQGGSASGYAVSPGSLSPASSASPRTADIFSPSTSIPSASQIQSQDQCKPSTDSHQPPLHSLQPRNPISHVHAQGNNAWSPQTNLRRLVASLQEQQEASEAAMEAQKGDEDEWEDPKEDRSNDIEHRPLPQLPKQTQSHSPVPVPDMASPSVRRGNNDVAALGGHGLRKWGSVSGANCEEVNKIEPSRESSPHTVEEMRS